QPTPALTLFPYTTLFRSHSSEMHQSGERHDEFRKLMTKDVNAAIEGAFQGGATEVVVNDAHWSMLNIIYEDLDDRAEIIRGGNKDRKSTRLNSSHVSISY